VAYQKLWLKKREWTLDEASFIWCDVEPGTKCNDTTLNRIHLIRGILDEAANYQIAAIPHHKLPTSYRRGEAYGSMSGEYQRPESALVDDLEKFALSIGEKPSFIVARRPDLRTDIMRAVEVHTPCSGAADSIPDIDEPANIERAKERPLRPAGVSAAAKSIYDRAIELGFNFSMRGDVSKAARKIAKERGIEFEAARRPINRVLRALREKK